MYWSRGVSCAPVRLTHSPAIPRSKPPISATRKPSSKAMFEFILRNARIAGRGAATFDIGIAAGKIAEIAEKIAADGPDEHVGGRLVTPGFVETHIHLDKSCILDRCRSGEGTLQEAIAQVAAAKSAFTEDDVYARARRTLEKAIVHGTTRMRTHVEVDPRIGLRGFEAIRRLKRDYAW